MSPDATHSQPTRSHRRGAAAPGRSTHASLAMHKSRHGKSAPRPRPRFQPDRTHGAKDSGRHSRRGGHPQERLRGQRQPPNAAIALADSGSPKSRSLQLDTQDPAQGPPHGRPGDEQLPVNVQPNSCATTLISATPRAQRCTPHGRASPSLRRIHGTPRPAPAPPPDANSCSVTRPSARYDAHNVPASSAARHTARKRPMAPQSRGSEALAHKAARRHRRPSDGLPPDLPGRIAPRPMRRRPKAAPRDPSASTAPPAAARPGTGAHRQLPPADGNHFMPRQWRHGAQPPPPQWAGRRAQAPRPAIPSAPASGPATTGRRAQAPRAPDRGEARPPVARPPD